jgi:Trk K+ transport system NAD-binding subunit
MSKSYRSKNSKNYYEDENEDYNNRSFYLEKRAKRNLNNAIKSKNVSRLLELDDDDDDLYFRR